MPQGTTHVERVRRELREAGIKGLGFAKFSIRYLPKLIHPDEHIGGVVYGRYKQTTAMSWEEGLLVATDRRVLFVDRKPGFLRVDEVTYDVVSGVQASKIWIFSAVTLYTRIGEFRLRFAKPSCVEKFVRYVEVRRLESLAEWKS